MGSTSKRGQVQEPTQPWWHLPGSQTEELGSRKTQEGKTGKEGLGPLLFSRPPPYLM